MERPKITQIGSLPFTNVSKALDYSLKHDIPFLPELIKLGDGMFDYITHPGELSCLKEFQKQRYDRVKIQCVGPVTLTTATSYSLDEAVSRAYTHIDKIIQGLNAKQTILFLDEPVVGYSGFDFKELWEPIFSSFNVVKGVHICWNMQWDLLFNIGLDIISFDASEYDITHHYKERGERIAWGIKKEADIKDYRPGDLITPPCGLSPSFYSEEDCERIFNELKGISEKYNNRKRE